MRKSMYTENYANSDDEKYNKSAHEFSNEISDAIRPIIKDYYKQGFKIRELIGLSMEACYIEGLEEYLKISIRR